MNKNLVSKFDLIKFLLSENFFYFEHYQSLNNLHLCCNKNGNVIENYDFY